MPNEHSITRDPVYYFTVGFFALLTTLLPAILGQPRFLPFIQAVGLTIFVAIALHHRNVRGALQVMAIWLPVQFILLFLLTLLFSNQVERAIPNGFGYRGAIVNSFFGGEPLPGGLSEAPFERLLEIIVVVLGSLVTAGFVGAWVVVRIVNQAAYGTAIIFAVLENPIMGLLALPIWTLLRVAGEAGFIVLMAEPLLTYTWSPAFYWRKRRGLILVSLGLLIAGLLLELFLPSLITGSVTGTF